MKSTRKKPGAKTKLTESLVLEIRKLVLKGKLYREIREELHINENTWDSWINKDYKNFRKLLNSWKFERIVRKSEAISEEILDIPYQDSKGIDAKVLSIKQKEAEFVRSTLDKLNYSKRSEMTGADGLPLIPSKEEKQQADDALIQFLNSSQDHEEDKEDNSRNIEKGE